MSRSETFFRTLKSVLAVAVAAAGLQLAADNAEASREYEKGLALYNARKYSDAASCFEDAELLARSNTIKANATLALIGCWRMCEMPYREFQAIEQLLDRFPEHADFGALVRREYALGNLYYQGKREPAFYALRWIPWLCDGDKSAEIYAAAIKRAPFAPEAPTARLRLAYLLDQSGKVKESLGQLRKIIEDYPKNPAAKIAMLALANGLYELSLRGDGDGGYAAEAEEMLKRFEKQYPKAKEVGWCRRRLLQARDIRARRLYEVAEFYRRAGRAEAAERYLGRVIRDFPDTLAATPAEKTLAKLDKTFVPVTESPAAGARLPKFHTYPIPREAERILLAPGERGNHFLLPVPDLKGELAPASAGAPAGTQGGHR